MNIKLNDTIFNPFFNLGTQTIKKLDADRLLAPCFEAMGKEPKKSRYAGWEAKGIAGHTLGHYMSALAFLYSCNKDEYAKSKAEYCVNQLGMLQGEDGYIAGFPQKDSFDNVFLHPDSFTSDGFELGGWWVPYYSLHKIFRGLLDIYKCIGIDKSLCVAKRLGDWVCKTTATLNEEQRLRLLKCEYGGMNEVLARLVTITKDKKYLSAVRFFTEENLLKPLANDEDILSKKHANTQIPKVIGAVASYKVLDDDSLLMSAENFFDFVADTRTYCIGGHSVAERFEEKGKLSLETNCCETCNTNNMLTLAKKLWDVSHDAKYFHYIEKALYNHILASNDESGMKTYFVGMKPDNFKVYSTAEDSFWCCFGSGLENPFSVHKLIYAENDGLYLNLFIPSEFESKDLKGILSANRDGYAFTVSGNVGKIFIRKPLWSKEFSVKKDGILYNKIENGYIVLDDFVSGETIEIYAPMDLCVHTDNTKMAYFTYGPFVLGEKTGNAPCDDHAAGENDLTKQECSALAPLKNTKIQQIEDEVFSADGHTLIPFYKILHGRFRVYFEVL